jgi:dTDP-4-amino-4,6-dideoxygalactose transaminase
MIPFTRPYYPGGEAEAVADVIASRWVTQGPKVREFEAAFAERMGAAHALATTNGTAALQLTLYALGVGPGDEVIVPSLSFVATANVVWQCGAQPVFADVDPDTFNLDPGAAERAISPRTKAIMPVHQIGLPADMNAFTAIAERHGLALVADAAPAVGARYRGREMGALGAPACFSLHARKVITTGEGGMVTTDDAELAERLRRLRHHGMDLSDLARTEAKDVVFESYPERGWNQRMTDIQAAIGLCQLDALDDILAMRRELAERYSAALADHPWLQPPVEPDGYIHSWQSYAVRLDLDAPVDRLELMRALLADGIATRRGVAATHHEQPYREGAPSLPHTDAAARDTLLLPLFPELSHSDQDYILDRLALHLAAPATA